MSLIRRLCRDEGGTVIVLASVAMLVLLGSAALAVDVGVHAAQKRQVVTAVDAAALAGARHLPDDPAQAKAAAIDFAQRNGLTLEDSDISFENSNKRIVISAEKQVDTFFARVLNSDLETLPVAFQAAAEKQGSGFWELNPGIISFKDGGEVELKGNLALHSHGDGVLVHSNGKLTVKGNVTSDTDVYGSATSEIEDECEPPCLGSSETGVNYDPPLSPEDLDALRSQAVDAGQYFTTNQEIEDEDSVEWTGVVYVEGASIELQGTVTGGALIVIDGGKLELKNGAYMEGAVYQFGEETGIEFKDEAEVELVGALMSLDKIELKDDCDVDLTFDPNTMSGVSTDSGVKLIR